MKSEEYIKNKLEELVGLFSKIKVKYQDHFQSNSHLIEVEPSEFFYNNREYLKRQTEITFEFISLFPSESLIFLSNEDIITLKSVDFELKGKDFAEPVFEYCPAPQIFDCIDQINENININITNSSSLEEMNTRASNELTYYAYAKLTNLAFSEVKGSYVHFEEISTEGAIITVAGEENYALAA